MGAINNTQYGSYSIPINNTQYGCYLIPINNTQYGSDKQHTVWELFDSNKQHTVWERMTDHLSRILRADLDAPAELHIDDTFYVAGVGTG